MLGKHLIVGGKDNDETVWSNCAQEDGSRKVEGCCRLVFPSCRILIQKYRAPSRIDQRRSVENWVILPCHARKPWRMAGPRVM